MTDGDLGRTRAGRRRAPWQRRRRRAVIIALAVLLIPAVWLVWRMGKRAELNEAMAAMDTYGVVATASEYEARYGTYTTHWESLPIPPDSPYHAVLGAYVLPPQDLLGEVPRFRSNAEEPALQAVPYADPALSAMEAFVASNATSLALLRDVIHSDFETPASAKQRELLMELLYLAACMRAHGGDSLGAFQALDDSLLFLRGGGGAVDQVFVVLESVLRRVAFTGEQLAALQRHLTLDDWAAQQREGRIRYQSSIRVEIEQIIRNDWDLFNMVTGVFDVYRAMEYRAWCIRHDMIGLSAGEQRAIMESHRGTPLYDFLRIQPPPVDIVVADAALDVLRYHADHGALPNALDDLVPEYRAEIPLDFWSGGPLLYRVEGPEFVLYSVGQNFNDDGADRRWDIVFNTAPHGP